MNKKTTSVIVSLIVIVAIIAGFIVATSGSKQKDEASLSHQPSTHHVGGQTSANNDAMSNQSSEPVATKTVEIKNYMFSPMSISIKVGDTVTWTNEDSVQHSVTADTLSQDAPASSLLSKGESYSFTFTKAGTYKVHCTPHPYMKQTITVTE